MEKYGRMVNSHGYEFVSIPEYIKAMKTGYDVLCLELFDVLYGKVEETNFLIYKNDKIIIAHDFKSYEHGISLEIFEQEDFERPIFDCKIFVANDYHEKKLKIGEKINFKGKAYQVFYNPELKLFIKKPMPISYLLNFMSEEVKNMIKDIAGDDAENPLEEMINNFVEDIERVKIEEKQEEYRKAKDCLYEAERNEALVNKWFNENKTIIENTIQQLDNKLIHKIKASRDWSNQKINKYMSKYKHEVLHKCVEILGKGKAEKNYIERTYPFFFDKKEVKEKLCL